MPASKHTNSDTAHLPSNIMDLRDEAFYALIRQIAGKRVAELLAFQEYNRVDSFLGCGDVTSVLHLDSNDLCEIKRNTCITLSDGTISLLPGIESSINNLTKTLQKKREEIRKQFERIQSITPLPLSIAPPTLHPSLSTCSRADASTPITPANVSSIVHASLASEITNKISTAIVEWLKKKQTELRLTDVNLQLGNDFDLAWNNRRDGIVFRCKCGVNCGIAQTRGVLVVSCVAFIYRRAPFGDERTVRFSFRMFFVT